jgi:hypothetical protein
MAQEVEQRREEQRVAPEAEAQAVLTRAPETQAQAAAEPAVEMWSCQICTYENHPALHTCEICLSRHNRTSPRLCGSAPLRPRAPPRCERPAAPAASAASADAKPKKRKRPLAQSGSKKMRRDADSLIGRRVLRCFRQYGWYYGTVTRPGA